MFMRGARNHQTIAACLLAFAIFIGFMPSLLAQTSDTGKANNDKTASLPLIAPVPPQILNARKIFIANDAPPTVPSNRASYSGGADRAYIKFYGDMKTWGHYEIVANPADADIIFDIRLLDGAEVPDQFRLSLRDPKTNVLMWRLYQPIEPALLPGNRDKNFDRTVAQLIERIAEMVGTAGPSTPKTQN
jgi:hypothetical protein